MNNNKCFIFFQVGVVLASAVMAETGVWINEDKNENVHQWMTGDYWQDKYVPINEMDSADLSRIYAYDGGNPAKYFAVTELPYQDCVWNAFIGTNRRRLIAQYTTSKFQPNYYFSDLSRFEGFFDLGYPFTLNFCASTLLMNLCANNQPIINVTNADYIVVASNFYDRGWVKKIGPGVLRYDGWSGQNMGIKMAGGSLELLGTADEIDHDGIPAGIAFWFDASYTNDMTLVENDDGSISVTQWKAKTHANGWQSKATPHEGFPTPKLIEYGPNGWMVDFGARINYGGTDGYVDSQEKQTELQQKYGRSSALDLDNNSKIRELFYAYESNDPTRAPVVLGSIGGSVNNYGYYDPPRTTEAYSAFFDASETASGLRSGEIHIDGNRVSYQDKNEVAGMHVVSAYAGDGRVSAIGIGGRHAMAGGMKLGEIIAYTTTLTSEQRRAVVRYLMRKWINGVRNDRAQDWDLGAISLDENTRISVGLNRTAKVREISSSAERSLTIAGGGTLAVEQIGAPPKGTDYQGNLSGSDPFPVTVENGVLRLIKTLFTGEATAALPYNENLSYHLDASDVSSYTATEGKVTIWRDKRMGSTRSAKYTGNTAYPTVKERVLNGLNMLSTGGVANNGTKAFFNLQNNGENIATTTTNCREGFIVFAEPEAAGLDRWAMPFGSQTGSQIYFEPRQGGQLIGGRFNRTTSEHSPAQPAGWFALNGVQTNPETYSMIREPVVYSCHFHTPQCVSALAHRGDNGSGGVDFGEVLLYDRELSPIERRNIETYLMKKWLGKDHPSTLPQRIGVTHVASAGRIVLEADTALDVTGDFTVAGGTLEVEVSIGETIPKVHASGAFSVADGSTIKIASRATEQDLANGRIVLAKANSFSIDPDKVTVIVPTALSKGNLKVSNGELSWRLQKGLVLVVR